MPGFRVEQIQEILHHARNIEGALATFMRTAARHSADIKRALDAHDTPRALQALELLAYLAEQDIITIVGYDILFLNVIEARILAHRSQTLRNRRRQQRKRDRDKAHVSEARIIEERLGLAQPPTFQPHMEYTSAVPASVPASVASHKLIPTKLPDGTTPKLTSAQVAALARDLEAESLADEPDADSDPLADL